MPNVSDAAQDKVAAVRALLERMTVPCRGTNLEPDPQYAGLRELVVAVYPLHRWGDEYGTGFACKECGDKEVTSRPYPSHTGPCERTRDWTLALSGSLYGAVQERLPAGWHREVAGSDRDLAIMAAIEQALTALLQEHRLEAF